MAIAEVQKVQILAHAGVKMEVLSTLQEEGLVQLERANCEELDLESPFPKFLTLSTVFIGYHMLWAIFPAGRKGDLEKNSLLKSHKSTARKEKKY